MSAQAFNTYAAHDVDVDRLVVNFLHRHPDWIITNSPQIIFIPYKQPVLYPKRRIERVVRPEDFEEEK